MSDGAAAGQQHTSSEGVQREARTQFDHPAVNARLVSGPPRTRDAFGARVFGVMGMSLGVHMALLAVLGFMPKQVIEDRKLVEMEIAEPEPPPPPPPPRVAEEPPPTPAEAPAPKPKLAPKFVSAPKPAAAEPPPQEAKPVAEAPVDLTGATLTGADGASWTSVVGNGEAFHGPAARIGKVTGNDHARSNTGVVGANGDALAFVAEASLSRKPVPPEGMGALLEQFFPARARAQGVAGSARLNVRILPDGRVGEMSVLRETSGDYGFGSACMKALRQRRWQAPLDKRGQPVATEIRYTCDFEVSY